MCRERILIVDDEPRVAFFFRKHLELTEGGYVVDVANSGSQALAAVQRERYDLMITDLRMPGMNGLELLGRIREISPATRTMLITAFGTADVWQRASELQVAQLLSKPLKVDEFLAAVRDTLTMATPAGESGVVAVTGEGFAELSQVANQLRVDLSAQMVLLADTSGQILFSTGETPDIDLPTTMALLGGNMAAAAELKRRLNHPDNIHLAYFEGPPYDIYAACLNENFFATVLFDRRKMPSRIGLVWLYLRRALAAFATLLGQDSKLLLDKRVAEEIVANLDDELEALFGGDAADVADLLTNAAPSPVETPQLSNTGPLPQAEPKSPLHRKVRQLIGQLERQSNLKLHAHTEALDVPLNQRCGSMVLRLLGVSLKNIYQHAGATHVTINFEYDGAMLRGNIIDNGVGFDLEQMPPFGSLADLQRHIIVNHGEFVIYSAPARGTTISFTLPV